MQTPVLRLPLRARATQRPLTRLPRSSLAGATGALAFGCVSFTPSLLPRDWGMQGVVGGLSAGFGYGVGVLLAWLVRTVSGRQPGPRLLRRLWVAFAVTGVPLLVASLWLGQRWQLQIHRLMGVEPPSSYASARILALAFAVLAVVVVLGRAVRWLVRRVRGWIEPVVPDALAGPAAAVVVVLLLVGLNDGVVSRGLLDAANSSFGGLNDQTTPGTVRPTAAERSGSPASLVSWESLGRRGRDFVAQGPTLPELTAFTGRPAREPVRVYVGLRSAPTTSERADLAVRELRRAGGFDRAVLVVATTTGTGLVDPAAADTIEYLYDGDTAIVTLQYSYLPSWISFLADRQNAETAGRVLFDRVHAAWARLPAAHRPRLLVTGSSLGAFGSEAAFRGVGDLRRRTDGVVWAGPPSSSLLHARLETTRDPGSPEGLPVYGDGRTVRFAATPQDMWAPAGPWRHPRVLYLQNTSDPVVFWDPRLLFSKPAWLSEPRGHDVSPDMTWIPFVTFWQVTADLPFALDVPPRHGHNYCESFVDAWAAVAPPPGWTAADSRRLEAWLRAGTDCEGEIAG